MTYEFNGKDWEYRDGDGNILQVRDSTILPDDKEVQEFLKEWGYDGPGDWESA